MKKLKSMDVVQITAEFWGKMISYTCPFKLKDHFLFLGEINRMTGHCAIIDSEGHIHWAYHTDSFELVPEEEL